MKKALVLMAAILLILPLGCANKKQNNNAITNQRKITDKTNAPWQETPIFLVSGDGNVYRMRGIKGRIAFVESSFIKGQSKGYE